MVSSTVDVMMSMPPKLSTVHVHLKGATSVAKYCRKRFIHMPCGERQPDPRSTPLKRLSGLLRNCGGTVEKFSDFVSQ